MDIGYYILIKDQDKLRIKLRQTSIRDYEGCTDMAVVANFNLTLSCQITSTNKVSGDYSCSVAPANLDVPGRHHHGLCQVGECESQPGAGRHEGRARRQRNDQGRSAILRRPCTAARPVRARSAMG